MILNPGCVLSYRSPLTLVTAQCNYKPPNISIRKSGRIIQFMFTVHKGAMVINQDCWLPLWLQKWLHQWLLSDIASRLYKAPGKGSAASVTTIEEAGRANSSCRLSINLQL